MDMIQESREKSNNGISQQRVDEIRAKLRQKKSEESGAGFEAAREFKYQLQFVQGGRISDSVIQKDKISCISVYKANIDKFNKFAELAVKYKIDVQAFFKFFVRSKHMSENDVKDHLLDVNVFNEYFTRLQILKNRQNAIKMFVKSSDNIVNDCLALGYFTCRDFLRHLIKDNLLANYYISGRISRYFFAGIPKFNEVISHLDQMTKDEFTTFVERYEIYQTEINDAFMCSVRHKVNPMAYVDEKLKKRRLEQK